MKPQAAKPRTSATPAGKRSATDNGTAEKKPAKKASSPTGAGKRTRSKTSSHARPHAATARTARPVATRAVPTDPLAAERTAWLAHVLGGRTRLARLLGVSPSQTTRWASGEERPGARSAPLLIDLEHVLARVRLVWGEPAATVWLTSANSYLSGARPMDVLRLQGPGPVLAALDAEAWGSFS